MRILRHDVYRTDSGRVLAAYQRIALTESVDLLGEQTLQVSLHTVLDEAGVNTQVGGVLVLDLVDTNHEAVIALSCLNGPQLLNIGFQVLTDALRNVLTLSHQQGAGRAHPVQRLVGTAVGVNEDGAVILDHQQAGSAGQVGAEAALIIYGAFSNDNTHPSTLAGTSVWL